jgi:hypothetical protein
MYVGTLWVQIRGSFFNAPYVATLALGSRPRQRVPRLREKRKPRVMSHAPGSARKCEGIDPHTPKGTPTLGVEVSVDFQIFIAQLQGSKPITLKSSIYQ